MALQGGQLAEQVLKECVPMDVVHIPHRGAALVKAVWWSYWKMGVGSRRSSMKGPSGPSSSHATAVTSQMGRLQQGPAPAFSWSLMTRPAR